MANPKKSPEQKQSYAIKASFTAAEYEAIVDRATRAGLLPAEFAYRAIVRKRVVAIPQFNREVWAELAQPLGNLAAIAHLLSQANAQGATIPTRLLHLLDEELLALRQLRQSLIAQLLDDHTQEELPEDHDS